MWVHLKTLSHSHRLLFCYWIEWGKCLPKIKRTQRRNKDLPLNSVKTWAKKTYFLCVKGASSVRNNQNELMLKIFVFTFGGYSQFSTCHKFVRFPDRYKLSESSVQKSPPVKMYVGRAVEKLCARASSTFIAQASNWFRWSRFLNFQLELCRRFDVSWAMLRNKHGTVPILSLTHLLRVLWKSVVYMPVKILKQAITVSSFGYLPNFFHRTEAVNVKKTWHWSASNFEELWSFRWKDTFHRLEHFCLSMYLVSRQRNHLSLKARNSDTNSVQLIG